MASFDEITWTEYFDFSAGLYQMGNDRECPPNGLLACTDCYPQLTGGLRAWGQWHAVGMVNIPTNSYIFGIFHIPGPNFGSFAVGGVYLHAFTPNAGGAGNHTFNLEKYNYGTNPVSSNLSTASWTLLRATTGITQFVPAQHMVSYRMTSGAGFAFRDFYNIGAESDGMSTGASGIYKTDGTTATTANVRQYFQNCPNVLLVHQSRMLNVGFESFMQDVINYTSQASATAPSTLQFLIPVGEYSSPITWIAPIEPSDLMFEKQELGIYNIQGDITSPFIRQMEWTRSLGTVYPVQSRDGLYIQQDGVYLWDGSQLSKVSSQLLLDPMSPDSHGEIDFVFQGGEPTFTVTGNTYEFVGRMATTDEFLFAGKGYVMDLRTKAWFQVTTPDKATNGTEKYFCVDVFNHHVFASRSLSMQNGRNLVYWEDSREESLDRASSYSFTLPLIYNQGQQTVLRELEYQVDAQAASSTISVTIVHPDNTGSQVSETLATVTIPGTGPQKVRIGVDGHPADWWKVSTTLAAPGTSEAPILEKMVTGTMDATRYKMAN